MTTFQESQVEEQISALRTELDALRRARTSSRLTFTVVALAGALVGAGIGVGAAQEPEQSAEVEALRMRVDDLQREIRRIGELWDKPVELRAPFEIYGDRGTLLRVSERGSDGAQLDIMDGSERTVIRLGGVEDQKGIFVRSSDETLSAALMVSAAGTGLSVADGDNPAVFVGVDDEGVSISEFYNAQGDLVAWIGVDDQGGGNASVTNAAGKLAVELKGDNKGGVLKVFSPAQEAVGGLLSESSGGQLLLTGASGGVSLARLTAADSGGRLQLFNVGGQGRATVEALDTGGAMRLFGGSGTALVEAEATAAGRGMVEVFPKSGAASFPQALIGGGK